MDLTAFAGALQTVQGNMEKLRKADVERQMLQLEMLRSAPPGYKPTQKDGPFGPEYGLEYVGMGDPRIQASLEEYRQKQALETAGQLAAAQALHPLHMQEQAAAIKAQGEQTRETQDRAQALDMLQRAGQSLSGLNQASLQRLTPDELEAQLGPARGAIGAVQGVAPDMVQRFLQAQIPEVRQALGGVSQNESPVYGPAYQPAEQPAQAQPAQAPAQATRPQATGAEQPPARGPVGQIRGPGDVFPFVDAEILRGRQEGDVRAEAIQRLEAYMAPRRGLSNLRQDTLTPNQVVETVDQAIDRIHGRKMEASQEAERGLKAEAVDTLRAKVDAKHIAEAGLTGENLPFTASPAPTKEDPEATTIGANANAVEAAKTGDAGPITLIRRTAQRLGMEPDRVSKALAGTAWPAESAAVLQRLGAQPMPGAQGVVVINAGRLALDESGRIKLPLRPTLGEGIKAGFAGGLAAGAHLPSLSPEGLAEHVWMAGRPPESPLAQARYAMVIADAMTPDVKTLAARSNPAVQRAAEQAYGHKLPLGTAAGNVLLLDLAALRGEGR